MVSGEGYRPRDVQRKLELKRDCIVSLFEGALEGKAFGFKTEDRFLINDLVSAVSTSSPEGSFLVTFSSDL